MHDLNLIRFYVIFALLSIISPLFAQNSSSPQTDSALFLYHKTFDNELKYINGREYKPYHHPTHQNPFLNATSGIGSIFMHGKEYKKKQLTYDIYKDLLIVIPDYYKFSNVYVQINKSEIDSFTINFDKSVYHFVNYKVNNCPDGLEPGFYQPIYKSQKSTLLVKHYVISGVNNAITTYRYTTDRFLLNNHKFYNINRKKSLLNLYPDHKKQIKREMKSINYSYKKMTNNQLIHLFNYIDTL